MYAVVSSGHADFSDICFLVAFILCAIACVGFVVEKATWLAVGFAGVAFGFLGWLVL